MSCIFFRNPFSPKPLVSIINFNSKIFFLHSLVAFYIFNVCMCLSISLYFILIKNQQVDSQNNSPFLHRPFSLNHLKNSYLLHWKLLCCRNLKCTVKMNRLTIYSMLCIRDVTIQCEVKLLICHSKVVRLIYIYTFIFLSLFK